MFPFEMGQRATPRAIPPLLKNASNFKLSVMKQKPVYLAPRSHYQEEPEPPGEAPDSRAELRHGRKEPVMPPCARKEAMSRGHQSTLQGLPLPENAVSALPAPVSTTSAPSPRNRTFPIVSCLTALPRARPSRL